MKWLRRLLGALVLLLAAAGLVGCLAVIIGIWTYRQDAIRKVESISTRIDAGLQRLSNLNQDCRKALAKARADVSRVNEESAGLGGEREKKRLATDILRKLIDQRVGPNVNELSGRLAGFSDAAVAVASLLQSLQEVPLGQSAHLNPNQLERASGQALELATTLRKLQNVVGDGDKPVTERDVTDAAHEVDRILGQCQTTVADWRSDLDAVRDDVKRLEARIVYGLTLLAVTGTVLGVWVALGQASLFAHGWKWCFGS